MSLQIWLPLNGDLHNQGLKDFNIIGNNITFIDNGKIGKCANFNGSNSYIYINNVTLGNNWSYGCWINTPSSDSRGWEIVIILNNTGSDADSQLAFWVHQKENRFETLANTQYNSGVSYAAYYGAWHHFFATFNGNVLTTYMDGIIVNTKTITAAQYTGTNLTIGARCTGTNGSSFGNYFQGYLNDVRIYNHCLSDKEVEEIAKGLVLHYKLNNSNIGNENLLLNSLTPTSGNGATGVVKSIENGIQKVVADNPNSNWVTFTNHNTTLALAKGDSFTFSLMIKSPDSNKKPTVYFQSGMGYFSMQGTMSSDWSIIYYTGIWNIDNLVTNIHLGFSSAPGTYYIRYFKLEKGTTYTSWAPNHNDQEWSEYGCDNNIIYDSSGYNNNGTIIGEIELNNNSPRYTVATYINSPDPTTDSATGEYYISADCGLVTPTEISIAWWANPESGYGGSISHAMWSTTANDVASDYQVSAFNHRDTGFDVNSSDGVHLRLSTSSFVKNEWHYYVVTYDGQTAKLYKDGIQQTSVAFTAAKTLGTFTKILIGHSRAGGVHRKMKGIYSDFRVYATALTEDQILELYHTSATIDNNGNVYAREVVE